MLQILSAAVVQLSTDKDTTVQNIALMGENTLAFPNERRALVTGYAGASYGAKNGNADEATLTINVLQGSGDNLWLIKQDAHDFPVFSGSVACEFKTGSNSATRTYTLTDGTIISHRGLTISSDGSNENQSVEQWVIKFSKATVS